MQPLKGCWMLVFPPNASVWSESICRSNCNRPSANVPTIVFGFRIPFSLSAGAVLPWWTRLFQAPYNRLANQLAFHFATCVICPSNDVLQPVWNFRKRSPFAVCGHFVAAFGFGKTICSRAEKPIKC